jgi:YebC/PmpR family DNA-binding regulatory protein
MAGHNKWSKIKHQKAVNDVRTSKIFSKLNKEISTAVKLGGSDPEHNPRLKVAIQNAKGQNMPKNNIERAIKKAAGEDSTAYKEVTYEGYGPHGVAIFVEAGTDNINKIVANIRYYFNKYNGNLSKSGSLDFIFDQKGVFTLAAPEEYSKEDLELELIDAGAEEIEQDEDDGEIVITTAKDDFGTMQDKLEELGIAPKNAALKRVPKITKSLSPEEFQDVNKLLEKLEEDEDVQNVYHNVEYTQEIAEQLG